MKLSGGGRTARSLRLDGYLSLQAQTNSSNLGLAVLFEHLVLAGKTVPNLFAEDNNNLAASAATFNESHRLESFGLQNCVGDASRSTTSASRLLALPLQRQHVELLIKSAASAASPTPQSDRHNQFCAMLVGACGQKKLH